MMTRTKITFADDPERVTEALADAIQSPGGTDAEIQHLDKLLANPDLAFDFFDVDGDVEVERKSLFTGENGYTEEDILNLFS